MLKKLVFLICFSLASCSSVTTIKIKQFCIKPIHHEQTECSSNLTFNCGVDHCALNKETCEVFLNLEYLFRTVKILGGVYDLQARKFLRFRNNLDFCPIKFENLCDNTGNDCFYKQEVLSKNGYKINILKKVDCPCGSTYEFECAKGFCAANQTSCEIFNQFKSKIGGSQALKKQIPKCDASIKYFRKKIFKKK